MKNDGVLKAIDSVCKSNLENEEISGSLSPYHKYDVLALEDVVLF